MKAFDSERIIYRDCVDIDIRDHEDVNEFIKRVERIRDHILADKTATDLKIVDNSYIDSYNTCDSYTEISIAYKRLENDEEFAYRKAEYDRIVENKRIAREKAEANRLAKEKKKKTDRRKLWEELNKEFGNETSD